MGMSRSKGTGIVFSSGLLTCCGVIVFLANASLGTAKEIEVPSQYQTIGAALVVAAPGDTVLVTSQGPYRESVLISKTVTLVSKPAGARIESPEGNGITILAGADTVAISGFVITSAPLSGLVVDSGSERSVNLNLTGVTVEKCGKCGVDIRSGFRDVLTAENGCAFSRNGQEGIKIGCSADVELDKSSFVGNGSYGLVSRFQDDPDSRTLAENANSSGPSTDTLAGSVAHGTRASIICCRFAQNQKSGLLLDNIEKVYVESADFSENHEVGLELSVGNGRQAMPNGLGEMTLRRCSARRNGGGLRVTGKSDFALSLESAQITENRWEGVSIKADQSFTTKVTMKECEMLANTGEGCVIESGHLTLGLDGCMLERNGRCGLDVRAGSGSAKECSVTMRNCVLGRNAADGFTVTSLAGTASLLLAAEKCTIEENNWEGMRVEGNCDVNASITDVALCKNQKDGLRVGLSDSSVSSIQLSGTSISGNRGNGVLCEESDTAFVAGMKVGFSGESGAADGNRGATSVCSEVHMTGCSVENNGGSGLALSSGREYFKGGSLTLLDSVFAGNEVDGIAFSVLKGEGESRLLADLCTMNANGHAGLRVEGEQIAEVSLLDSLVDENGSDGLQLGLSKASSSLVTVVNTDLCKNKEDGIFNHGYNTNIALMDKCSLDRNGAAGIVSDSPLGLELNDVRIMENGDAALSVACQREPLGSLASVRATSCTMEGNGGAAISLSGTVGGDFFFSNSMLSNARGGIRLRADNSFFTRAVLNNSTLKSDAESPVDADSLVLVLGQIDRTDSERVPVLGYFGNKCSVAFVGSDCSLASTSWCTVTSTSWASQQRNPGMRRWLIPGPLPLFVGANGNRQPPLVPGQNDATEMAEGQLPEVGIPFEEWEKREVISGDPQVLRVVTGAFAEKVQKSAEKDLLSSTLKYLQGHPDVAASSLLFRGIVGPSVAFSTDHDIGIIASIVRNAPNSLLADTICSELASQAAYWPTEHRARDGFVRACQVSPNTIAATYTAAIAALGPSRGPGKIEEAFRRVSKDFPDVRKRSGQIGPEESEGKEACDKWSELLRIWMVVGDCLDLAKAWHNLREDALSEKYLMLGRTAALGIRSFRDPTLYLPQDVSGVYRSAQDLSPDAQSLSMATLLESCKNSSVGDAAKMVRKRLNGLRIARDASRRFPVSYFALSGVSTDVLPGDEALQVVIRDMAQMLQSETSVDVFVVYAVAFESEILADLSPTERKHALAELRAAIHNDSFGSYDLQQEYLRRMANYCQVENDASGEMETLESMVETTSDVRARRQAIERIATLYCETWKLPDDAIAALRRISATSNDLDVKADVTLKIAKILYEERNYQRAIYEIASILPKLPKQCDSAPLQTLLAMAYLGNCDYAECRATLATVISTDNALYREQCLYLMGYTYVCERKYADAVQPFKELVRLYPVGLYTKKAQNFLQRFEVSGRSDMR